MRYLSVCSGIEAATVAWHPLGWEAVAYAEIDKFPSAVLAHHYPQTPNWGDLTKFQEWPDATVDVLVGGTPCQSFSVAGLRAGLADPRGNLALTYLAVVDRYRPTWVVWENVPGVLSSDSGRDFGAFLGGLGQLGYGYAYRVLDAQHFGLAQRRARVFVVGYLGDWRRAAAVLFERESLSGHPPPRRETGQGVAPSVTVGPPFSRTGNERVEADAMVVAPTIPSRRSAGGGLGTDFDCDGGLIPQVAPTLGDCSNGGGPNGPGRSVDSCESLIVSVSHDPACTLTARDYKGPLPEADLSTVVAYGPTHSLRADGFDASEDGTGLGTPLIAFNVKDYGGDAGELAPTLRAGTHDTSHANGGVMPAIAFKPGQSEAAGGFFATEEIVPTLQGQNNGSTAVPAVAFQLAGDRDDPTVSVSDIAFALPANPMSDRGQAVAYDIKGVPATRGADETDVHTSLRARAPGHSEASTTTVVLQPAIAFDTTQITSPNNYSVPKPGDPCHPLASGAHPPAIAFNWQNGGGYGEAHDGLGVSEEHTPPMSRSQVAAVAYGLDEEQNASVDLMGTLKARREGGGFEGTVAFQESQSGVRSMDAHPTLDSHNGSRRHHGALTGMQVRRLTPKECARLQGFPDDYLDIPYRGKPAADGPKYKALGNSMAVPCMAWIGRRIQMVEDL